jgi:hypothetical protein
MKMGEHQVDENSAYWGDVGKLLHEKDQKLKELHLQFKMEQDEKKALKRLNQDISDELMAVRGDLREEQKKNETGKLKTEIESLRKLNK